MSRDLHAYLIRRLRLMLRKTEAEFAKRFGVGETAVSRWENGRSSPSPKDWSWIRGSLLNSCDIVSEAVRTQHTYKCVSRLNDLTTPIIISKGIEDALARIGINRKDLTGPFLVDVARTSPQYEISGLKALTIIQSNRGWIRGEVLYVEAHCYSTLLRTWLDCLVAPLPIPESLALIEAAPSALGEKAGFWVRFINEDALDAQIGGHSIH